MELILAFQRPDHIVGFLVHHVDRAAVYIQDDIISVVLIQMYHWCTSLSFVLTCIRQRLLYRCLSPAVLLSIMMQMHQGLLSVLAGLVSYSTGCLAC